MRTTIVLLLLLVGCHQPTDKNVQAAIKGGMSCWVEHETKDQSGIYCGDASLAPTDSRFVRWIKEQ